MNFPVDFPLFFGFKIRLKFLHAKSTAFFTSEFCPRKSISPLKIHCVIHCSTAAPNYVNVNRCQAQRGQGHATAQRLWKAEPASNSQKRPAAARNGQPAAARSSEKQPEAASSSQQQPAAARSSQQQPAAARRSPSETKLPQIKTARSHKTTVVVQRG